MNFKKEKVLNYIPEYLKDNEYFMELFAKFVVPFDKLSVNRKKQNYYIYSPYNSYSLEYIPFELLIDRNKNVDMTSEFDSYIRLDGSEVEKRKKVIISSKIKDNGEYTITTKTVELPNGFSLEDTMKQQWSETRKYDASGVLKEKVVRKYMPQEINIDAFDFMVWNDDVPFSKTYIYYYLTPEDAILREYDHEAGFCEETMNERDKRYYVTLKDGEEKLKVELTKEVYQEYYEKYSDMLFDSKYEQKKENKVLKKSFE